MHQADYKSKHYTVFTYKQISLHVSITNLNEILLETRPTHQRPINVWTLSQLLAVGCSHGTSVQNANRGSNLWVDVLLQPTSDSQVDLLGLGRCGSLPGPNCPDRLVGQDNLAPVGDVGQHGGQLIEADFCGLSSFPLVQLLANELVSLTEDIPSLRMPQNDPVDTTVLYHGRRKLPSKSSTLSLVAVLRCHRDVRV